MREGGEQVGLVNDVADDLAMLDDAGPARKRGDTDTTLKEVALAATVEGFDHSGRAVVSHRAIVGHHDHQRVLLDAKRLKFFHQLADIDIKPRQAFLKKPAAHGDVVVGKSRERGDLRPIGNVEGLLRPRCSSS